MRKILVIATGWHFSSHFYEKMVQQTVPDDWKIDYYCVAHRTPEDKNTIKEKDGLRESTADDFLTQLDQLMYEYPITTKQIEDFGWKFMLEENTIGDMECFNQWSEHYDYSKYDFVLITHDDNLILSDKIFTDIIGGVEVHKPIEESKYGAHQFNTELVKLEDDWLFLDNGYNESLPKAFTPRGSFSYFLYDSNSVDGTRWLSDMKRVSRYCIEGERGFIKNHRAGEDYLFNLQKQLKELGWI